LLRCDLLILDEFGYLPLAPQVGPAIYELIAGRYERRATVITSNKSLAHWGDLIGDSALMMAITDRLLHHGEVFYLGAIREDITAHQRRWRERGAACDRR
jgi:DNA replication protein DnaC